VKQIEPGPIAGFGLYVHWPFCAAKCPYCDFNSHVAAGAVVRGRWARAYSREIARVARMTDRRILGSIFFGGGTPSLMDPELVGEVLAAARKEWPFANDVEITLEANPGSADAGRFAGYRDAGVNRLSVGVQALRDDALSRLGRIHTAAEARAAFDLARATFSRVSLDLIYARQDQSLADWEAELREALAMSADHLSLYQLTIEDGTAFAARRAKGGLRGLPDDDLAADMFRRTQEICAEAGLPAYEVSNHAIPGRESRHNLLYWTGADYAGVGPGAHGRLSLGERRLATAAVRDPGAWLLSAESGAGDEEVVQLSAADQAREYLMMGLRLRAGISIARLEALAGARLDPAAAAPLVEGGWLAREDDILRTTPIGTPVLDSILRQLDHGWFAGDF